MVIKAAATAIIAAYGALLATAGAIAADLLK